MFLSCETEETLISFTYPNGHYKSLIMSYDDGVIQDLEFVALLNKHGIKGTFNLNSSFIGKTNGWPQPNGDTIYQKYIPNDSLLIVYKNHEIAAHGAYHKNYQDISFEEAMEDITTDIAALTRMTKNDIISFAYPFGNTTDSVTLGLSKTSITNARTVDDTFTFDLPDNYLLWNPTCHDSKVLKYSEEYIDLNEKELSVFYVWGHSWEFGDEKRWNNIKSFCKTIGKQKDIWFAGTGELTNYLKALEAVEIDIDQITNPADNAPVWIELESGNRILEPGESIKIKAV